MVHKVSTLSTVGRIITVATVFVATAVWGMLLDRFFPVDPHQLALHLIVGNICMSVVSALYLVNSIVSSRQWIAKYRRNA